MSAGIISTGKYIPSIKISNNTVAKKLKIEEKKFLKKLGLILDFSQIKERQFRLWQQNQQNKLFRNQTFTKMI